LPDAFAARKDTARMGRHVICRRLRACGDITFRRLATGTRHAIRSEYLARDGGDVVIDSRPLTQDARREIHSKGALLGVTHA